MREVARARIQMVRDQTKTKNRVMAILGKVNLRFAGSDVFGTKGREWLGKQSITKAKSFINRITKRGGRKKAMVALARKLAVIIYCILKGKRSYYK